MFEARTFSFQHTSFIPEVDQKHVWEQIGTWSGVNYELSPFFKMTAPAAFESLDAVPADGTVHFASWVLLFGFIPVDRHKFALLGLAAPHFFDERSSNLNMRVWTHKRTLMVRDGGVEITDECSLEPRISFLGGLLHFVFNNVFKWRHKRLLDHFRVDA